VDAVPEVLSFHDDIVHAGVGPEDPASLFVNASLRNPYPESEEFLITASVPGSPTWGIEVPGKMTLAALAQEEVQVELFIPRGERALEESELILKASSGRGGSWQDTCTIRILPYRSCSILTDEDVLIDLPLEGSFNITVRNDGNVPSSVRVLGEGMDIEGTQIEPGRTASVVIPYEVDGNGSFTLEPFSEGVGGASITVNVFRDGQRAHFLFDRISALVLLPFSVNSVKALSIGGDAKILSVVADDGTPLGTDPVVVGNLQRIVIGIDPGKETVRKVVQVRAIGEIDGTEVESNAVPVLLVVKVRNEGGLKAAPYIAGGVGGAVLVAAGSIGYLYAAVEGFRYRWLAIGFIPLYSIVHGEKVLDHFFRGRLYEYIKENPGVTFTALKKHFEVNNGNLTYHLHKLEREELIVSRAQGKFKLFYPDGIRLRDTEIVISLMDKDIMDMVAATPGIASQDVVTKLAGLKSKRTVSRHIKDLERKGLIEAYGEHRKLYISRRYDSAIVKDGLRLSLDINAGT
jgi:hypothetical protein